MVINTNVVAETAASQLAASSANLAKSLQRLSSGSKITSPQDDAAGLGVSMKFDAQSSRIGAARDNVSNAISFTQTQDGFLQQVSTALNRMSELAVSAQDITKTNDDRSLYQAEFSQLSSYIADISGKEFNGVSLFDGVSKGVTVDSDANTWGMTGVNLTSGGSYATVEGGTLKVDSLSNAASALSAVKSAISALATDRANVGANLSRLNYTANELTVEKTNIDAANSQIKDVDVAQESTQYAKMNILVQSGTAMLAQANALPQSVLKLLG